MSPWRNKPVEWRDCWQIGMRWAFIDAMAASGQYFIREAPRCESSLLLVAHSTSLSPLQSRNYCTVNSFPESIISCTVSLLFCSHYRRRSRGRCGCIDMKNFHKGNAGAGSVPVPRSHKDWKRPSIRTFGVEGVPTVADILKNWPWPKERVGGYQHAELLWGITRAWIPSPRYFFVCLFRFYLLSHFKVTNLIWTANGRVHERLLPGVPVARGGRTAIRQLLSFSTWLQARG